MTQPAPQTTASASGANRPTVPAWRPEAARCLAALLPAGAPAISLWTQFLLLPMTTFVYGLGFMVRTLQAVQQTAQQIVVANPNSSSPPSAGGELGRSTPIGAVLGGGATTSLKEVRKMSDCGCGNQCGEKFCEVKVYEYSILSVRPCHEEVLQKTRSLVITSNMSGEAFSNYAIALYCRGKEITKEQARYLRVCYRIMCTLPKESKGCCDNDQVEVLREIKNVLKKALTGSKQPPGAGAAGTSSAAQASAAA